MDKVRLTTALVMKKVYKQAPPVKEPVPLNLSSISDAGMDSEELAGSADESPATSSESSST